MQQDDKIALKARGYQVQFIWALAGFHVYYAFCGARILGSKNSSDDAWNICREHAAYLDYKQQEEADERAHIYADRDREMLLHNCDWRGDE